MEESASASALATANRPKVEAATIEDLPALTEGGHDRPPHS